MAPNCNAISPNCRRTATPMPSSSHRSCSAKSCTISWPRVECLSSASIRHPHRVSTHQSPSMTISPWRRAYSCCIRSGTAKSPSYMTASLPTCCTAPVHVRRASSRPLIDLATPMMTVAYSLRSRIRTVTHHPTHSPSSRHSYCLAGLPSPASWPRRMNLRFPSSRNCASSKYAYRRMCQYWDSTMRISPTSPI